MDYLLPKSILTFSFFSPHFLFSHFSSQVRYPFTLQDTVLGSILSPVFRYWTDKEGVLYVCVLIQYDHSWTRLQLSHLAHCVMYETVAHWAQTRRKHFGEFKKAHANMIDDEIIRWDEIVLSSHISPKWLLAPSSFIWQIRVRKCHSNYHMFDYNPLSGICEIKQNIVLNL